MKKNRTFLILFAGLLCANISYGQDNPGITDYLNVPGPIQFNDTSYNLVWSSHPVYTYFKAEYLPTGDTVERFHKMLMLDLLLGNMKVTDITSQKIAELEKLKKTNPVINYTYFENPDKKGEAILDFIISENTPSGLVSTLEWNIYHYKKFTDKSGHKGVLLFGISIRSYGNDIDAFLPSLKSYRNIVLPKFIECPIPQVAVLNEK
jgi:hypothetical protein